jgi:hypothetical protein
LQFLGSPPLLGIIRTISATTTPRGTVDDGVGGDGEIVSATASCEQLLFAAANRTGNASADAGHVGKHQAFDIKREPASPTF